MKRRTSLEEDLTDADREIAANAALLERYEPQGSGLQSPANISLGQRWKLANERLRGQ